MAGRPKTGYLDRRNMLSDDEFTDHSAAPGLSVYSPRRYVVSRATSVLERPIWDTHTPIDALCTCPLHSIEGRAPVARSLPSVAS